jgi:hypothetical protein
VNRKNILSSRVIFPLFSRSFFIPFPAVTANSCDFFLQLYKADSPTGAYNTNTSVAFPLGDIGFMQAIPPIGTKFFPAYRTGPGSQLNAMVPTTPFKGTLYLKMDE